MSLIKEKEMCLANTRLLNFTPALNVPSQPFIYTILKWDPNLKSSHSELTGHFQTIVKAIFNSHSEIGRVDLT